MASESAQDITTTRHNSLGQSCEDEPIRLPGSIQRHGFLLLLDEAEKHIVAASENSEEFFNVPLKLLLGASVDTVLEREVLAAVHALASTVETAGLLSYLGSFKLK